MSVAPGLTQVGEVANRILSVGDLGRAKRLSQFLEPEPTLGELFVKESSRGFVTITGAPPPAPLPSLITTTGMPSTGSGAGICALRLTTRPAWQQSMLSKTMAEL